MPDNLTELINETKKVCILATPTSGTHYIAKLLQNYGLKVLHEQMGEDGISDWRTAYFVSDHIYDIKNTLLDFYYWKRFKFETKIRLVRNPWNVLSTWVYWLNNINTDGIAKVHVNMGLVKICKEAFNIYENNNYICAASNFLKWQELIDSCNYDVFFNVENLSLSKKELTTFLLNKNLINIKYSEENLIVKCEDKNESQYKKRITENEFKDNIPTDIYNNIKNYAIKYNY